jgi:hypothetical protein
MMMNGKRERVFSIRFQCFLFSSSATSVGGRSQPLRNPTLDDVDYKILNIHENL